jgi:S-adenosylmethionine:tRNA ribosyltransferase-isomerase
MKTDQFEYLLPDGFVAQYPPDERGRSRLLVLDRKTGAREHTSFDRIVDYVNPGDVLVLNETRVIPARLFGTREGTGGRVEVLLLKELESRTWEAFARPGKKAKEGTRIMFGDSGSCVVESVLDSGKRIVRFDCNVMELASAVGTVPLPPYIEREPEELDAERYQTVFAREDGSVAAPTAGLHFTEEILKELAAKIDLAYITLHIGAGTFRPVKVPDIAQHEMDGEYCEITEEAASKINSARGSVIAVGTSVVRALETSGESGRVKSGSGETRLFIYPSYEFKIVDRLVTNFHLPRSTTLILTAAFAGFDKVRDAYAEAIGRGYRFYSYGDSMFIL